MATIGTLDVARQFETALDSNIISNDVKFPKFMRALSISRAFQTLLLFNWR